MLKKVGILINGGDAPGLNAVIRAIVRTAEKNQVECYGFLDGFNGILNNNYVRLDHQPITSGILHKGGAIIGSSLNSNVFNYKVVEEDGSVVYKDLSEKCVQNLKDDGIDCLFTLGGDSTQKSARDFSLRGINVIGVPKTIDNDVACTEVTFGFDSAVAVATEALDRLHTTAETHNRIMVLEVAFPKGGSMSVKDTREGGKGVINIQLGGAGDIVAKELEKRTGLVARNTTLGYLQRGGSPTAEDRILSTKYGAKAMELALEGKFNVLTVIKDGKLDYVSLEDVVGDNKEIGAVEGGTEDSNMKVVKMDDDLIKTARNIGICLGD